MPSSLTVSICPPKGVGSGLGLSLLIVLQMLIEIANMLPPKHLQPQRAPLPPARSVCIITGQPAKYRCLPMPTLHFSWAPSFLTSITVYVHCQRKSCTVVRIFSSRVLPKVNSTAAFNVCSQWVLYSQLV